MFNILFALSKDLESSSAIVVLGMLIEFFQLLSFPLDSTSAFPWNQSTVSWISDISRYIRVCTCFSLKCFSPNHSVTDV